MSLADIPIWIWLPISTVFCYGCYVVFHIMEDVRRIECKLNAIVKHLGIEEE